MGGLRSKLSKGKGKKATAKPKRESRHEPSKPVAKLVPGKVLDIGKGKQQPATAPIVRCRKHKDVDLSSTDTCHKCESEAPARSKAAADVPVVSFDRVQGLRDIGFDELVKIRQEAHAQMSVLKDIVESVSEDIKRHMVHSKVDKVEVKLAELGTFFPAIERSTRTSIDKAKLVELGVALEVIAKATKSTPVVALKVYSGKETSNGDAS